jgi:triosephosphate isomerase (TIM)
MDNPRKIFIVANWKSNITELEAKNWLNEFRVEGLGLSGKEIVVCPSFTLLSNLKSYFLDYSFPVKLGAQDISPMDEGAYTGGVNGKQIKEFAEYVIVGHSERRKNFSETGEVINLKIDQALKSDLTVIACVSNLDQVKALEKFKESSGLVVAYEPLFAIGSGTADIPESADEMAKNIKLILSKVPVLYGGSVTSANVSSFLKMSNISGVLVGKASLDPKEFYAIVQNA